MKSWLLYFLSLAIVIIALPIGAEAIFKDETIPEITVFENGEIKSINIEDFALRILIAKSDMCGNSETKKALAVAARSCGAYISIYGCKHTDFDICDNPNCCFDLGDAESCDEKTLELCRQAINDTFGLALVVDGIPAMALFSDCLGSGSENCQEFKYLIKVSEEKNCEKHIVQKEIPFENLPPFFQNQNESCLVYGENNKCDFGVFGGKLIKGSELAAMVSSCSDEMVIEYTENGIAVTAYGVGHGYGMSLCGAQSKADYGMEFEEIISFYYPRLKLNKIYHN